MSRMRRHTGEANCRSLLKIPETLMGVSHRSAAEAKDQRLTPSCQTPKAKQKQGLVLWWVIKSSENRLCDCAQVTGSTCSSSQGLREVILPLRRVTNEALDGWTGFRTQAFCFCTWFFLAGSLAATDSDIPTILPLPCRASMHLYSSSPPASQCRFPWPLTLPLTVLLSLQCDCPGVFDFVFYLHKTSYPSLSASLVPRMMRYSHQDVHTTSN